jgi:RNA polymerase sigma factor (sigma-70 family)
MDTVNFSEKDLTSLYLEESEALFRFLYSFTGDQHLAEDLLQEVFISIFKKLKDGQVPENPRSFLYTAAYFAHKNQGKSHRTRVSREIKYADRRLGIFEDVAAGKKSGLSMALAGFLNDAGKTLLSAQQQLILRYVVFSPLENREIMEITGLSKTSYYREMNNCFRIVRDALKEDGYSAEDFQ